MNEPTDTILNVRGRRVAARLWGNDKAPPYLALHGWLDNAASFDLLAPRLPDLHIVAVDLPGHGLSDHRPPGLPYHYVDWITDVAAIAQCLNWKQFGILGHSMGAGIACLFAGTFPAKVTSLVLIDGLGPLTADPADAPTRLANGIQRLLATEHRQVMALPDRCTAISRMCAVVPGLSQESARRLIERGMIDVEGGVVWRSDPRLRVPSLFRMTQLQVLAFLRGIDCPVLVIQASQGYPFDKTVAEEQFSSLRHARRIVLPGGHHLHMDCAEAVADQVRTHLLGCFP